MRDRPGKQVPSAVQRFGLPLLISAVFLSVTLPNIGAPDLFFEEGQECVLTLHAVTTPGSAHDPSLYNFMPGTTIGDRFFPLMEDNPYVGAIELYMQLPLFAVLGVNAFSIRLLPIVVGLIGILSALALCRRWFGPFPALLAGLLAATHPVIVHYGKEGHDKEEFFTAGFFWLGLLLVDTYFARKRRKGLWLVAGIAVWGMGLSHKITFLWYVLGLIVVVAVLRMKPFGGRWPKLRHAIPAAICFPIGAFFTVAYNITYRFETLRVMWVSLWTPTPKDNVDNLHYLGNAWVRLQQFNDVILAGELWDPNWFPILGEEKFAYNYPFAAVFFSGWIILGVLLVRNRLPYDRMKLLFLYVLFGVVFLCSPFTVSYHHPSHLLVLNPFPEIVMGLFLAMLPAVFPVRRAGWVAVAVTMVLLIALNLNLVIAYHIRAARSVGHPISAWEPVTLQTFYKPPPDAGGGDKGDGFKELPDRW
jgi:4-amino-4-deoxy-L-arabinose transferase-like glycosyltransferase